MVFYQIKIELFIFHQHFNIHISFTDALWHHMVSSVLHYVMSGQVLTLPVQLQQVLFHINNTNQH
jgi:hypothetical protein